MATIMKIIKVTMIALAFTSLSLIFSINLLAADKQSQAIKPDVRLLIDISGSMKKNDPNNLRIPALQLVTNLMPKDANAGVWAFGRYVNMMVPLANVDAQWQNKATQTAKKINSAGLFTNIGGVLSKASYGWNSPSVSEKRSMILLTDGMVDISKDQSVNDAERVKILEQILPKLKRAGVTIHTVALSKNADHELLKTLSTETDGWYQAVESAEELEKVFLKIFEQSAARDSLPLNDNKFNVDSSIEEMTLLVFKQSPLDKTRLIAPDKSSFEQATADGKVRWFSTSGYDLITVQKPQTGGWRIDANVDPDNRVMVVSKLSLAIKPLPNNLLAGEAIDYQLSLLEEGNLISKPDFLNLVEARLVQKQNQQTSRLALFFDQAKSQFKQNFFTDEKEGLLNLTLEVKSPTFERIRHHAVNIYGSPLTHQVVLSVDESRPHSLDFIVRDDIVKPETLEIIASVTFPDDEKQFFALENNNKSIPLKVFPAGGDYRVQLTVKGQSNLGRKFSVTPETIEFSSLPTQAYLDSQAEAAKQVTPVEVPTKTEVIEKPVEADPIESEPTEEVDTPPEKKSVKEPDVSAEQPQEEQSNWSLWLLIGLAVNIILGGAGFFIWKMLRNNDAKNTALMADELGIEDDETSDQNQDTASDEEKQ
jgi:uncharacterized protein (TIGR03503 family)